MSCIQEIDTIVEKWNKTGLLKKLHTKDIVRATAVLLENQRTYNEKISDPDFKRLSLPLVRRIVPNLFVHRIAAIQPQLASIGSMQCFRGNKLTKEIIEVKRTDYKARWSFEAAQDLRAMHNIIDAEVELCEILAMEIQLETDRRMLHQMKTNAAIQKEYNWCGLPTKEDIEGIVIDIGENMKDINGGRFPSWVVMSREFADLVELRRSDIFSYSLSIHDAGMIRLRDNNIKVYIDPLLPVNSGLIGFRGTHLYDTGYIFCPLIMVGTTNIVLDPNSFVPRRSIYCESYEEVVNPSYFASFKINGLDL